MMTNKFFKILPIFFLSTFSYADPNVLPKEPYTKEHAVWLLGSYKQSMESFKNHSERLLQDTFDKAYLGQTAGSEHDHKMALNFQCESYNEAKGAVNLMKRYPQYNLKATADGILIQTTHDKFHRLIKTNYESGLHRCRHYSPL